MCLITSTRASEPVEAIDLREEGGSNVLSPTGGWCRDHRSVQKRWTRDAVRGAPRVQDDVPHILNSGLRTCGGD